jgi:selenocysteine lyase/cysteine desulfurase
MQDRRQFLGTLTLPAAAALGPAPWRPGGPERLAQAFADLDDADPRQLAADEALWDQVSQAFSVDRSAVNLNNGGVSPSPTVVQAAHKRLLDFSNELPPHNLWRVLDPRVEGVRQQLARLLGCDAEEVAITRNTSESLQTCQQGFDLERGDEVLTSDQDYPRMINTFRQRELREGLVLRTVPLPVPAEDPAEVARRFEQAIGPRTRMILVSHVVYLTGQILPVREVVAVGRRHGIPVIVDGAHAFAHFPFTRDELDCDYYGTSLHKWLFAPHGTGLLYVRRERIGDLWPLLAAPVERREDIRKFEEIGTHPAAGYVAIGEAIAFHHMLGPARKAARLRYLRDLWARRLLAASDRVRLHTSLDPRFSCGIATFEVEGVEPGALSAHLWNRHRIFTTSVGHDQFAGVRVSPSVYTQPRELERFCDAVEDVLRKGLPS